MPSKEVSSDLFLPILLLVILVAIGVVVIVARRRSPGTPVEDAVAVEAPGPDVTAVVAAVPDVGAPPSGYIVQEVFVVYSDGRLVKHCARAECETQDADLMSGMLIAIQGLIQDGLQSGGKLESIKYGENTIHMVPGSYINLAAVIYGKPDRELEEWMDTIAQNIEAHYAGFIEDWTGDLAALEGLDDLVMPLIEGTAHLTQEDVKAIETVGGISLLSAVDFYMGYVRLKVAAANMSKHLIANASFEVEYDSDMLRLEKAEPESLKLRGDRVDIGNVKPGDRKTVAFYFDPQVCQGTSIDGSMAYFDSVGERHRVNMKRRQADVVCPIFFTKEHANTAMLRKLVAEKLYMSDFRAFRYPEDLEPSEVLTVGKRAINVGQVQLVREYVVPGPPFEAEVWYYGETKVKNTQLVMRLGVVEEKGALEFFAAATAMEPITGLLSEFRRELNRIATEKYAAEMSIEPETDAEFRRDLEDRELLIYKFPDEE